MLWTPIDRIEYDFLRVAVKLSNKIIKNRNKNNYLLSIYMDKKGECTLTFKGKLSLEDIYQVKLQFSSPYEETSPVSEEDYQYSNDMTFIYTPDGLDLRSNTIW